MMPLRLSAIIAGILLSAALHAGVYRWVDENGVTVYSQVPPPADIEKKLMEAPPPPPVSEEKAWEEVNRDWREMRDRQDVTKEQAIADSEKQEKQQKQEENCETAQRSIKELRNPDIKFIQKRDGTTERLSAKEREKQLSKARDMEEEYCR